MSARKEGSSFRRARRGCASFSRRRIFGPRPRKQDVGTDATYPLRRRSRTPARRGPAGRRPAHHPAVTGKNTRNRSRWRNREVRRRVSFRASIDPVSRGISLLRSFRPGRRERRGRGRSFADDPSQTHLLVPRKQGRFVPVRGQRRVVPSSAPRERHRDALRAQWQGGRRRARKSFSRPVEPEPDDWYREP